MATGPDHPDGHHPGTGTSTELTSAARRGDPRALDALFSRELPQLRRWAHRRLPGWARGMADTVDLVQDAMLNTFRRLDALEMKRRGALQAYLRRAIQNRILDELRLYRRRPGPEPLDSTTAAVTPSPLDLTLDEEAARRYREALLRLRPAERELIVGRIELGYSYDQLAMAAGRPTAESARLAVRRAILRLASEMDRA